MNKNNITNKLTGKKIHRSDIMLRWKELVAKRNEDGEFDVNVIKESMEPLPAGFKGARFGHDSIRIEGSEKFIWAVLTSMEELLFVDDDEVRLEVFMHELKNDTIAEPLNDAQSHWACYIRPIYRGTDNMKPNCEV